MSSVVEDQIATNCPVNVCPESDPLFRVAVIGCGPKGMYCLERLAAQLAQGQTNARVQVTIFDPARYLGAGNVYDPRQPHFLRMNFAAKHIDAWPSRGEIRDASKHLSLCEWLSIHAKRYEDGESYVPRAIVGSYLHDCYQQVRQQLSEHCEVQEQRCHVGAVRRRGHQWELSVGGSWQLFDELLVTIGHEGWRSAMLSHSARRHVSIDHVYPVDQQLSTTRVPPGSTVAIQGFGLTWIDAALGLTEGREGVFSQQNGQLRYELSGQEPQQLIPFSRTGRPMLAKPVDRLVAATNLDEIWSRYRDRIETLPGEQLDWTQSLWPIVLAAADDALHHCQVSGNAADWFHQWMTRDWNQAAVIGAMRRSTQIAKGNTKVDAGWAIGQAWRCLYPQLVKAISHGRLAEKSWNDFRRTAGELERIAFGPPAENVERILALADAGLIEFGYLVNPTLDWQHDHIRLGGKSDASVANRFVNATIPSPCDTAFGGPLASLLSQGFARRMKGAGGIEVDHSGRPLDPDGNTVPGLAIIGRPTEGCVLGNDTLSRTLHPHPAQWAASVAQRLQKAIGFPST